MCFSEASYASLRHLLVPSFYQRWTGWCGREVPSTLPLENNALIGRLPGISLNVQSCQQRIRREQVEIPAVRNSHSVGNGEPLPWGDRGTHWNVFYPSDIGGWENVENHCITDYWRKDAPSLAGRKLLFPWWHLWRIGKVYLQGRGTDNKGILDLTF